MSDTRPNILWICTDQQRFDTIHALGNEHIRTPNLDRLVAEGVTFLRAYSQSPICTPSRCSFLTGKYPSPVHVNRNGDGWFPEHPGLITRTLRKHRVARVEVAITTDRTTEQSSWSWSSWITSIASVWSRRAEDGGEEVREKWTCEIRIASAAAEETVLTNLLSGIVQTKDLSIRSDFRILVCEPSQPRGSAPIAIPGRTGSSSSSTSPSTPSAWWSSPSSSGGVGTTIEQSVDVVWEVLSNTPTSSTAMFMRR